MTTTAANCSLCSREYVSHWLHSLILKAAVTTWAMEALQELSFYSSISVFSTHSNSLARLRKAIGGMNSILGSFLLSFESIVRGSKGSRLVKIVPMTHYVCLAHMKIRVLFKTGVCLYIFVLTKNSACVPV